MILVSACLAGVNCRYDGTSKYLERLHHLVEEKKAVLVCPEVLGGLATPREPAEIVGGNGADVLRGQAKVLNRLGEDVTEHFVQGAYRVLELAQQWQATCLILKESSPSCGSSSIYSGDFNGKKVPGFGVTAALLKQHGFPVYSELELAKAFQDVH